MADNQHAINNAKAWFEEIKTWAALDKSELNDPEEGRPEPLCVEIRSGWYTPRGDSSPEEFQILLSTGGPALRLIGSLDEFEEPCDVRMEWQDWGTPWTEFLCDTKPLLAYAQSFYFGE